MLSVLLCAVQCAVSARIMYSVQSVQCVQCVQCALLRTVYTLMRKCRPNCEGEGVSEEEEKITTLMKKLARFSPGAHSTI